MKLEAVTLPGLDRQPHAEQPGERRKPRPWSEHHAATPPPPGRCAQPHHPTAIDIDVAQLAAFFNVDAELGQPGSERGDHRHRLDHAVLLAQQPATYGMR